jgi:succinoglycan biosynthesis protein ExoA
MSPPPQRGVKPGSTAPWEVSELPFVSIVVPARNEERHIGDCLEALQRQTYPHELLEILVADGRSSDRTPDLVRKASAGDSRVKLLENPSGRTAAALNIGIEAANGSVICRMDGHAIPADDYVERCVTVLQETRAWCVGGQMQKVGATSVGRAIALAATSRFGVGDSTFHYATEPREVESVFLGCWPREVFEKIGLFDTELVRNQDDELSYRIRRAGGSIWFDPGIRVRYFARDSLRGVFSQHRQYGRWKVRVFQKHPGAVRWRHLVPGAFVASLGSGLLTPIFVPFGYLALAAGSAYVAAVAVVVARLRSTHGDVRRTHLAGAFAAMHLGYGLGLWQGLLVTVSRGLTTALSRRGGPSENDAAPR